jgi:uncharacterized protein (TIRG00374 family)
VTLRRRRLGRILSWALALTALAFVAWIIPVRDRCWDRLSPTSTRVAVSRTVAGCVLHLQTGDVPIDRVECARLQCEPGVASAFANARGVVVASLFGLYMLSTVVWAARWRALLAFAGVDLPLAEVWRVTIEAQAGGILLPGGFGGDALRIASVLARPARPGEVRSPAAIVIASVLLDRAVGLALIATVAAALGFTSGGPRAGPLVAVLAALPVALLVALVVLRRAPIDKIGWLSGGRLASFVNPVLAYVRDPRAPRAIALAAGLSVFVAAVQFGVVRGLVLALGAAPVQEKWVYVGTAMAFIVAVVPALPGGWGTADATYVFFFGLAGIAPAVALAVCLIYRLFWYLTGVMGAMLHVTRPRGSPLDAAADRAGPKP